MTLDITKLTACRDEAVQHLTTELLPFWLDRCRDDEGGGFLTHFDGEGNPSGETEKSLIAQARTVYTMASAHRAGYGGGRCGEFASHGVDFLLEKMWDDSAGGFFWMTDQAGKVTMDKKIVYGQSFAIYALSEYTLATGDRRGVDYAQRTFDLLQKHAVDTLHGGYYEMFDRDWQLAGPGPEGGDRKTLDVHMHLMEAFTTLYECTGSSLHRRKLLEDISIITDKILHPDCGTGIPQFST
ncbi:MAG TPA: N-acylglucosamine 2-epimerase, partial [Phycisphaerae bacterium]|nr:N-acylglucosamine 2-epimerase [Phycisphaerae bacterium]